MALDLVAALWAELAAIEPARKCCRAAERAGLGAEARGRARTPAIGRLAVRLEGEGGPDAFDWGESAAHCRFAHLRGLLLAHGSLSISAAGTHLELVLPASVLEATAARVAALGFPAGARLRRGRGVLTWKEAESIIGLLRRLGSSAAAMEIETRLLGRSLHGHMNRVVNAESANVRRAVEAAHRQLSYIEELERQDLLRRLSRRTKRVVAARRRSPEATFGELAAAVGLSRGQVQRAFYEVESVVLHQADGA
ncbi:MAG: DNA-binding protein WhiA [Chloroflexota bacterium]